ncbi:dehydrogenase [Methanopyrus kandleri]|uniref:Fragment of predicted dehydrogenase related to phosphoglycerate dehydrogenase n=2 Tax=Methanopyrus kandleri TaxID=2320 RepID=Q8TYH5_METKA|nr:dehydrogenase [Methanopyrus kandleri]AAM01539.1 Fragment of predicted dehydrogenase related to phosphoglycerate dehydrogenase [Methanopyrus kandleri AV19]HII70523.1 hypothetical protein [Methanopyrus kandleri]
MAKILVTDPIHEDALIKALKEGWIAGLACWGVDGEGPAAVLREAYRRVDVHPVRGVVALAVLEDAAGVLLEGLGEGGGAVVGVFPSGVERAIGSASRSVPLRVVVGAVGGVRGVVGGRERRLAGAVLSDPSE